MYFDLEDYRPDTPRSPRVMSWREVVLTTIVVHLLIVLAIVLFPDQMFRAAQALNLVKPEDQIRFVDIRPQLDRVAPPRRTVDQSDLDRRAMTREVAPKPENPAPLVKGNSPEKFEGAPPEEKPKGPETPQPAPPQPTNVPEVPAKVLADASTPIATPPKPAGGSLGESLRNLKKSLQNQTLDNPQGGQAQQGADIQFDSKGVDFGPWLRRFKAQVEKNWWVPEAAWFLKGHVVIQFYVERDGRITDLKIVEPSTVEAFNGPALNSLRMSNPTMPLPTEYPSDRAFFTVTFHYNEGIR